MAERADITVDWGQSPRIITVAAPSVALDAQDLVDTLRSNTLPAGEADNSLENLDSDFIVDADGKTAGVVGITVILQNAQLAFEQRTGKPESGTVTTANTAGVRLIDSTSLFQTNGVLRNYIVLNAADGSHATVLKVISETELETTPLNGGTDNRYDLGDAYEVLEYESCTVSGGNLFAVDDVGADLDAILNTFGTNVVVEQSISPVAAPLQPSTIIELDSGGNPITAAQSLQVVNSILGSKVNGVTTTTERFRNPADTKDRITVSLDVNGNRTAVVLNLD